ncbi:MAG: bacteriochlorophyll 4-vinyl reductase [Pseudomonadota bacterium]
MGQAPAQTLGDAPRGVVGPNAVIQLANALGEMRGADEARKFFVRAGFPSLFGNPPADMIDEDIPAALLRMLWDVFPAGEASEIARDAGRRTADYVIANRIPAIARTTMSVLPTGLSARMLLKAIHRNAWTFAGSGTVKVGARPQFLISIRNTPLTMPDCAWHTAVFEKLFQRLVTPVATVRNTLCCWSGAQDCRFELKLSRK